MDYDRRRRRFNVAWTRESELRTGPPKTDVFSRTATFPEGRLGTARFLSSRRAWGLGRTDVPAIARLGRRSIATWFAGKRVLVDLVR